MLSLKELLANNRLYSFLFVVGALAIIGGLLFTVIDLEAFSTQKVEVLETKVSENKNIVVEIRGAVKNPGVYDFSEHKRVEDLINMAGGVTAEANLALVEQTINRASRLADGQKVYIPKQSEASSASKIRVDQSRSQLLGAQGSGLVNINTATVNELDSLPGIGQVYGQNIIEQRPYSSVDDLLIKGVLKKAAYDKVKDLVTAY